LHKGNVISGNAWDGIYINHPQSTANFVQGNYIGTDASGGQKVGNGNSGIYISNAPANNIGGLEAGARNVISGNGGDGILIEASGTTGTLIQGNYIGTDLTGALPLGNADDGVHIQNSASGNLVGGTANGAGNLISGNGWSGVRITAGAFGNTVQGNTIGTDPGGTLALGNAEQGVSLNSPDNLVGGTEVGAGNHIAHNSGNGIYVETGTGNALESNLVWDNGALGIDLDPPGITPNDTGDVDSGPNNLQNFPLLTSVSRNGAWTFVEGTLNSTPNTTYRLEFFANTACDPSGNGEGASYLGSQDVATDANGNASFSAILPAGISGGKPVSATATDPGGNTSEFSACRESISGAYTWHYQYDARYRLTGAYYSDGTYFRYTYDAYFAEGKSGNRLSEETVTGTITYTYDSANRLASVGGVPYTWDNNGNLLNDGAYTYTYNHANQLVSVSGAGTTVNYSYNGQGDRVSQTTGITTTTYTLDLAAGLTQVLSDGTDTYLYGNGRIAQYDTSGAQYFLGDALGSVRQLVDVNGDVLLAQSYEPYGAVLASAGDGISSYGFAAEMRDSYIKDCSRPSDLPTKSIKFCINFSKSLDLNNPNSIMVVG
jgi:YD repeat-containing protein